MNVTIKAASPAAFRKLVGLIVDFYAPSLIDPHWGEQIRFRPDNVVADRDGVPGPDAWPGAGGRGGRSWTRSTPQRDEFKTEFSPLKIVSTSAREFWAPTFVKRTLGFISRDDRPGAPRDNVFWPGDQGQAGQFLCAWLKKPAAWARSDQAPRRRVAQRFEDPAQPHHDAEHACAARRRPLPLRAALQLPFAEAGERAELGERDAAFARGEMRSTQVSIGVSRRSGRARRSAPGHTGGSATAIS